MMLKRIIHKLKYFLFKSYREQCQKEFEKNLKKHYMETFQKQFSRKSIIEERLKNGNF